MQVSDPCGPVGECVHPRARRVHGTRAAYVADRCRCTACRRANRRAAQARRRAIAYGRWQPYTEAGPVREHVQALRAGGFGVERIIAVSGVGSGTVRRLLYGNRRTGAPLKQIKTATAHRLLAVEPGAAIAAGSLCDAAGTARRLQGLIAAGWSLNRLAGHLGRDPASVRASMNRTRVRARTVIAVRDLYTRLAWSLPPQTSPAQRREVAAARDLAARHGWVAPVAGDPDADHDVDVDDGEPADLAAAAGTSGEEPASAVATLAEIADIDEVAVAEAMRGRRVHLTLSEQVEAIDRLTGQGRSLREIAALLHTSPRTVSRRRRSSGREATVSDHSRAQAIPGCATRRKAIPPEVSGVAPGRDLFRVSVPTRGRP
jgi:hypothetical protein